MSNSLIPERPLLISPTLAATIGLEEAVLLHVISELQLQNPQLLLQQKRWTELSDAMLARALPFWTSQHCLQILHSLQQLGLVLCEAVSGNPQSRLVAINQADPGNAPLPLPTPARPRNIGVRPGTGGVATLIPAHWQPDTSLLQQCAQRNIPAEFIEQEVPAFVLYWRERGKVQYSWNHSFLSWVVARWEKQRAAMGAVASESAMHGTWQPSEEAVSILEHAGINPVFIEDAIPEFVLYWRERGINSSEWNSKFIAHVRRQWIRFTHTLENDNTPRTIPPDFRPDPACFDILTMANIDTDFAWAQVPEFILYWQDRNEVQSSWNTKFLQHVKFKWAQQMQPSQPLLDKLTDRSWAD